MAWKYPSHESTDRNEFYYHTLFQCPKVLLSYLIDHCLGIQVALAQCVTAK